MIVVHIRRVKVVSDRREDAIQKVKDGGGQTISEIFTTQPQNTVKPIPYVKWPVWAEMLARLSTSEDKGLGDTAKRIIGDENSDAFKKWFELTFNKDCGCAGRQRELNQKYPLPIPKANP